jgi:hypothetical protein
MQANPILQIKDQIDQEELKLRGPHFVLVGHANADEYQALLQEAHTIVLERTESPSADAITRMTEIRDRTKEILEGARQGK